MLILKLCRYCGIEFKSYSSQNRAYCNKQCSDKSKENSIDDILNRLDIIWPTACWEWIGGRSYGYGRCSFQGIDGITVHKLVYEYYKGPIPKGLEPHHRCKNKVCANPDHMEILTRKEHLLRHSSPTAINSRKTHCPQGHPLSGSNLYIYPSGSRGCQECMRNHSRKYQRQKNSSKVWYKRKTYDY